MKEKPTVITQARIGRTPDADSRTRRYLWTMGFRVACIIGMLFVTGWWRLVLIGGAAILPTLAVLLANAADRRSAPTLQPDDEPAHLVLTPGPVIPGSVEDDVSPAQG